MGQMPPPLILYYTLITDHGVGGGSAVLVRVIVPGSWALPPWGVCGRGRKDVCGGGFEGDGFNCTGNSGMNTFSFIYFCLVLPVNIDTILL